MTDERPPQRFSISPEEDIPTIEPGMLESAVDFERGMSPLPWLSFGISTACIVVFVAQAATGALGNLNALVAMGALDSAHVAQGDLWRLWSATFMHAHFAHIAGNLLMLYVLGMACEHAYGMPQFLFLYVVSGLTGSLASCTGQRVSVGASGAIFGLAGALTVFFRRHKNSLHLRDKRIGFVLAMWAVLQFVGGFLDPMIDNRAHLGGLVGGAVAGTWLAPAVLYGRRDIRKRPLTGVMLAAAIVCLAYTAVSFVPRLGG